MGSGECGEDCPLDYGGLLCEYWTRFTISMQHEDTHLFCARADRDLGYFNCIVDPTLQAVLLRVITSVLSGCSPKLEVVPN